MRTVHHVIRTFTPLTAIIAALGLLPAVAAAVTVNAVWNSATDVPVTAYGYYATGRTVSFTLNFAPIPGTELMVVSNQSAAFINGTFNNLTNGQAVVLSYGGTLYQFVANYYGGTGNDLVLVWASNRVFAWGCNSAGQLGDNTQTQRPLPVPVTATGVLAGKTILALAAGGSHSLALCSDGTVAAWGDNTYGQLGDNSTTNHNAPVAVNTAAGVSALSGKTVVGISAGYRHSLAVCSDGTVAAWGSNNYGQLGDNTVVGRQAPVAVYTATGSALSGRTAVAVVAGWYHSLALCADGGAVAWGRNVEGQLGDNTGGYLGAQHNMPVSVLAGNVVLGLAAGFAHSLALCQYGTVSAWGQNSNGQLGDTTTTGRLSPVGVNADMLVSALYGKTVTGIAAGGFHSLALCSDGTVASWGADDSGQLGDNTPPTTRTAPVAVNTVPGVSALADKMAVAVAVGYLYSLALCSDGTATGWGANSNGQLGDNSTTQRNAAVAVNTSPLAAGECFAAVVSSSAAQHTLALVAEPPAPPIRITSASRLTNGSFQFAFTNSPGLFFSVVCVTNPALALTNWTSLTGLMEVSPGQYQFTDPQAANAPRRYYRVRWP